MKRRLQTNQMKIAVGFVLLFVLYHAAEYFVLFQYNPIAFLLLQGAFFISAALIARWQGFKGLAAWGLDVKQKGWLKQLLVGMLLGILLYGISFLVSLALHSEDIVAVSLDRSALATLTLFCFGSFFSSFSEDVLTRGYVYKHFKTRLALPALILLSPLIYVLNHIYRLDDGWLTWSYLFALGILFIIPVVLTRRLWFTGGMHWLGNTTFFFTHNVITTKSGTSSLSPNLILLICIFLFMPISVVVIRLLKIGRQKYKVATEDVQ